MDQLVENGDNVFSTPDFWGIVFPFAFFRYHQLTGKSIMDVVRVDSMESGKSTTTVVSTASLAPTAFRAPRYNLSIEKSKRSVIEPVSGTL